MDPANCSNTFDSWQCSLQAQHAGEHAFRGPFQTVIWNDAAAGGTLDNPASRR